MFRRNYESILVFPGFSTGTESTRRRAVNAPLHPAKKEPQRVRHLAEHPSGKIGSGVTSGVCVCVCVCVLDRALKEKHPLFLSFF